MSTLANGGNMGSPRLNYPLGSNGSLGGYDTHPSAHAQTPRDDYHDEVYGRGAGGNNDDTVYLDEDELSSEGESTGGGARQRPFSPPRSRATTARGSRPSTARPNSAPHQQVLSSRFAGRLRAVCEGGVQIQFTAHSQSEGGVIGSVEAHATELGEAEHAKVYLMDSAKSVLWCLENGKVVETSVNGGPAHGYMTTLSAALQVTQRGEEYEWEEETGPLIAFPMHFIGGPGEGKRLIGVLVVGRGDAQLPFNNEDKDVLRLFARTSIPPLMDQETLRRVAEGESRMPTKPSSGKPATGGRPTALSASSPKSGRISPSPPPTPPPSAPVKGKSEYKEYASKIKSAVEKCHVICTSGLALMDLLLKVEALHQEVLGDVETSCVYVYDVSQGELWSTNLKADRKDDRRWSFDGDAEAFSKAKRVIPTNGEAGKVATSGRAIDKGNVLFIPITTAQGVCGVLELRRGEGGKKFSEEDKAVIDVMLSSLTGCLLAALRLHLLEEIWHISGYEQPARDVAAVMRKLSVMAKTVLHVEHCTVVMMNRVDKCQQVWLDNEPGIDGDMRILDFPMNRGIVGHVGRTGEMVVSANPSERGDYYAELDAYHGRPLHTLACLPVVVNSMVEGVLYIANKAEDESPFGTNDFPIFKALANHASNAIQVAQVSTKMDRLMEMSVRVNSELDLVKVMQMLMDEVRTLLSCDRATLFLLDTSGEKSELWSAIGDLEIRIPSHAGIAGHVATTGEILNIPDAYKDPRFNQGIDKKTGYKTDSILCFPLKTAEGNVVGCAQLINKLTGVFTVEDEVLLGTISSQAVVAIQNSKLFAGMTRAKDAADAVMTAITALVVSIRPDGTLESCNHLDKLEALTGHDGQFMKTNGYSGWLANTCDVLVEDIEKMIDLAKAKDFAGKTIVRPKVDMKLPNGKEETYEYNLMPIMGVDNSSIFKKKKEGEEKELQGVVITMEDQTAEKQMQATLSQYMDPALVDQLLGDGDGGSSILGGKRQKVSILFADIRSFTSLSEGLDSADVVALLNEYFTIMVDIVLDHKGILDKYIGDAFMVEYGIPFVNDDDTYRSCMSALCMMDALHIFNADRAARDPTLDLVSIGIGINTDLVLSGNIGSPKRMEYTVIGDGVNLASRLEGSTKQYKCSILISGNTYDDIKDTGLICRQLDLLQVVGKKKAVRIYELVAKKEEDLTDNMKKYIPLFAEAKEIYCQRKWAESVEMFKECNALGDKSSLTFIERAQHYIEHPEDDPGPEWTGVYVSTSK